MEFVIIGSLQKPSDEIKCTIQKLGGKLVDRVHSNVAAVISTADEVERMESQMQEAKAFDIQVVSVDFLTAVTSNIDPVSYIVSESLCDWGGSVSYRHQILMDAILLLMKPDKNIITKVFIFSHTNVLKVAMWQKTQYIFTENFYLKLSRTNGNVCIFIIAIFFFFPIL